MSDECAVNLGVVSDTVNLKVGGEQTSFSVVSDVVNLKVGCWARGSGSVPDEPSIELDLSDALVSVFAAPITGATATFFYNRVGNWIKGNLGILCTPDTVWPEPPEGFPFTTIAIKGSDLPFMPRVLPMEGLGELPQTMGFGLANIADNMGDFGDPEKNERYGLGGATSIVGGLLEGDPGIIFFKTEAGKGSLGNLLLNGYEGISFVGRVLVIYCEVNYEIDPSAL